MNFRHLLAKYRIDKLRTMQLPELALQGLMEGMESESLVILAGMSKYDSAFEIQEYFEKSLIELKIDLPDKRQAAIIFALGLIEEIENGELDIIKGIYKIKNTAIDSYDFIDESDKFCYDSIGFEIIYGLFDEYFEIKECGDKWNEEKKEKLSEKIKSDLLTELLKWKEIMDRH